MHHQRKRRGRRRAAPQQRRERAERILDTAADLIARWGYDKTTMDDIARAAGVAKGVLYQHWPTRDALLMSALLREWLQVADDLVARVQADPEGATLHGMFRHSMLATMQRPLSRALLLRDPRTLGSLAQREYLQPNSLMRQRMEFFRELLRLLRAEGLLRGDLSPPQIEHLLGAVAMGFMTLGQFWPEAEQLTLDDQAQLLAEVVRRTVETERPMTPEARARVLALLQERVGRLTALVRAYLDRYLTGERNDGND